MAENDDDLFRDRPINPEAQRLMDRMDSIRGAPEWDDARRPYEDRINDFVEAHARSGISREQMHNSARQHFPGTNPADLEMPFAQAVSRRESEAARERFANAEETTGHWWRSRLNILGVNNAIEHHQVFQARERIRQGVGQRQDFDTVAEHERLQQLRGQEGIGSQVAGGLVNAGGLAMEATAGGALARATGFLPSLFGRAATATTAAVAPRAGLLANAARGAITMPSMILNQVAEVNESHGRDVLDIRGLPLGVGLGVLQAGVLGSLGHIADDIPGRSIGAYLQRYATRIGVGMGEQQIVDVVSSFAQGNTGYGLGGDVYRWLTGEEGAGKKLLAHALVQATTFAAFAGMHEAGGRDRVRDAYLEANRALGRSGLTAEAAAQRLTSVAAPFQQAPLPRAEAMAHVNAMPERTKAEKALKNLAREYA